MRAARPLFQKWDGLLPNLQRTPAKRVTIGPFFPDQSPDACDDWKKKLDGLRKNL